MTVQGFLVQTTEYTIPLNRKNTGTIFLKVMKRYLERPKCSN